LRCYHDGLAPAGLARNEMVCIMLLYEQERRGGMEWLELVLKDGEWYKHIGPYVSIQKTPKCFECFLLFLCHEGHSVLLVYRNRQLNNEMQNTVKLV
jgi:hypothetical protein